MTVLVSAGTRDPGEAAVRFLEQARTRKIKLEPGGDTALSPQTSEPKRKEIARRLERLAGDLGTCTLEVGEVKLDDDLAAVLVRTDGSFDPSRLQVFPVALVKRGGAWIAAPVPASFENSGVGYAPDMRQRVATLEDWMRRQQALDMQQLRDESAARMRRKISASLPPETLRQLTSRQAAERFLTACEQGNLPEILGLLGGLAGSLPDDWPLRLKAAEAAVTAKTGAKRPWRLLLAPEVMRMLVHHEEDGDSAAISLACLDPAGDPPRVPVPRIELVHLDLSKSADGLWQVDPPESFLQEPVVPEDAEADDVDEAGQQMLDSFSEKLSARYPLSVRPTAEGARDALLETLRTGGPAGLMPLIRLDAGAASARNACVRAAQIWWSLREPANVGCVLPLAWRVDGPHAAAACQFFSARNPDRLELVTLYFENIAKGWSWTPEPAEETTKAFQEWSDQQSQHGQDGWRNTLLGECPVLATFPAGGPPTDDEARQLIESWLKATRAGDVMAALRLTARLDLPDSPTTLLRNLGYDLLGTHRNPRPSVIAGIHRGKLLAAVGTQTAVDNVPSFPLYPVVATPRGPRILLEIDLLASGNRSRDFLNRTALARLRHASADAAAELSDLYQEHQSQTAASANP